MCLQTESLAPLVLAPGEEAPVARLRLRSLTAPPLRAALTLHTNLTDYSLPLLLYEGRLHFVSTRGSGGEPPRSPGPTPERRLARRNGSGRRRLTTGRWSWAW